MLMIFQTRKMLSSKFILEKVKFKSNWIAEFNIVNKSIPKKRINIIKTENSVKSTVNIKRNKIIWKNNYIETSYLSYKMLFNSLLFNKIESSVGADKCVKVLDIQEKPFMKPFIPIYFFIFGRKQTENIQMEANHYFNGKL